MKHHETDKQYETGPGALEQRTEEDAAVDT